MLYTHKLPMTGKVVTNWRTELLISTYVVCERLSVMHEPAGVVEILVQILPEYPPFWSTVSEYPPNENCQRVQIREFQNTPPKGKLSENPNLRGSEYLPQNENCQRVQIWEFQNTPPMEIVRESKSKIFRIPPNKKLKTLVFRWFKFTLKPPYSIAHDKLRLAIWDTSYWTFWLKFGHKGPWDIC